MMLRPGRVKDMVRLCITHDVHTPCHSRMIHDRLTAQTDEEGLSEINLDDPVCRGFYDLYPRVGQVRRIAERLNLMREVD
jgi:hypothetical protein